MKRIQILIMAVLVCCNLTACNTISGIGKDIKKGGESIEKAAGKGS